jgi:MarR family 2-MHQ and catechol resistance regulon transcriptional repressor
MAHGIEETSHVWLVMLKAMRALTRYAAAGIEGTGLGASDFGVLEVLLHKGPLPVNTIGPIVDLTPGSISIAVDRERLGQQGRERRRPPRSDRRPHPARQGPHCSGLPKACGADEESVLRTESGGASRARRGAEESRQARCRAHGAELSGSTPISQRASPRL